MMPVEGNAARGRPQSVRLATAALLVLPTWPGFTSEHGSDRVGTEAVVNIAEAPTANSIESAQDPEELVVTGSPLSAPGVIVPYEVMQHVHDSRAKGACLYRAGRYEESFPHLLAAAKRGFKHAQARVGFLYSQGIGVERDPLAAVGWLGVAASGTTHPEIRRYFNGVWDRIPDEHLGKFEEIVGNYRSRYGSRRHRVECDLHSTAGTHFKKLTCGFRDEANHVDFHPLIRALLTGYWIADPFPTSNPVRRNRAGC